MLTVATLNVAANSFPALFRRVTRLVHRAANDNNRDTGLRTGFGVSRDKARDPVTAVMCGPFRVRL